MTGLLEKHFMTVNIYLNIQIWALECHCEGNYARDIIANTQKSQKGCLVQNTNMHTNPQFLSRKLRSAR